MEAKAYLFFNGQAQAALDAYAKIFGTAPINVMRMGDGPPDMGIPAAQKDWVMHSELPIGGTSIYVSDDFMANSPAMAGCSVMINCATAAEGKRVFEALAAGGEVRMKWEPTFWSAGFGACSDAFGIRWMVGCDEMPGNGGSAD